MKYVLYIVSITTMIVGVAFYLRWKLGKITLEKRSKIALMFNREEIDSLTHCGLPLGDIHLYRPSLGKTIKPEQKTKHDIDTPT